MQLGKVANGANPDGTVNDDTVYVPGAYNDNMGNVLKLVQNAGQSLIDDDLEQVSKAVVKQSLSTFYTDNGSANNVELDNDGIDAEVLFDGMVIIFTPANANTGTTTLKIKTLDAKPLYKDGAVLVSGFLKTDEVYTIKYSVANARFDVLKSYSAGAGTSEGFVKPDNGIALFIKTNANSFKIPAGTKVVVGENTVSLESDTVLSLDTDLDAGTKTAGTDYYIYTVADGSFYLSLDKNKSDRLIGGFHYGLVAEAEALTGNKTEADMVEIRGINSYSFWDLKFRPVASPEGMVHINGRWYDIYLLNSEHITNGTSKAGLTIAGGATNNGRAIPKIPLEYGGDGTLTYGKFTWFQACEIAKAHSKQLINYAEFPTIAYGVLEGDDSDAVDGALANIEHYDYLTSKFGIEQAAGVQYIWGADVNADASNPAWQDVADGRGRIYANSDELNAVVLGGYRSAGVGAGSRASAWHYYVWYSYWYDGCRFSCGHMNLV